MERPAKTEKSAARHDARPHHPVTSKKLESLEVHERDDRIPSGNTVGTTPRTKLEVARIIEQFLNGSGGAWDWDDFCCNRITDPYLDSVRIACHELRATYPPKEKVHYCGPAGFAVLREMVAKLRASGSARS
jgi:hypothetical protein